MRLFSIQTLTGELLGKPPVTSAFNFSGGLHVRSDGTLVGLAWNPDTVREELHVLDPASGENALIAPIPTVDTLAYAVNAYDRGADKIYMVGAASNDPATRLFVVDAKSGTLLGSPVFTEPVDWSGIHVRADGILVGVSDCQNICTMFTVDPNSAGTEVIADLVGSPAWISTVTSTIPSRTPCTSSVGIIICSRSTRTRARSWRAPTRQAKCL